jgi:hypothetical protein
MTDWSILAEKDTKGHFKPAMEVYTYNYNTWEAESGGSLVWGQPRLHSKTLSQKEKKVKVSVQGIYLKKLTRSCWSVWRLEGCFWTSWWWKKGGVCCGIFPIMSQTQRRLLSDIDFHVPSAIQMEIQPRGNPNSFKLRKTSSFVFIVIL